MICQVDTTDFLRDAADFLREKHSLRKPPHAFGSELVRISETGLLKKTGILLSNITISWATIQEMLLILHILR